MTRAETAQTIADMTLDWLKAEVDVSSREYDRNQPLNELKNARASLYLGYDNPSNSIANKSQGHLTRLRTSWWEGYTMSLDPDFDNHYQRDFQAAKLIFAGLMEVSGTYRDQCYVQARSQEDYQQLRNGAIGIDINQVVLERVERRLPADGDLGMSLLELSDLDFSREVSMDIGGLAVKMFCDRAERRLDFNKRRSESVRLMKIAQKHWLNFVVDGVLYTAKRHDGVLAAVPFLEPISITDQSGKLYYPLAEPVNWQKELPITI
jgi:hypothetical protein